MAPKKESGIKEAPEAVSAPSPVVLVPAVPLEEELGPPPPSFEELWFDDPVEGREAQKMAFLLRENVELKATPLRIFLETGIIPLLLQGLQHLVAQRPSDPVEYLAAFLLKNNPRRDMIIREPERMGKNSVVPDGAQSQTGDIAGTVVSPLVDEKPAIVATPPKDAKKQKK